MTPLRLAFAGSVADGPRDLTADSRKPFWLLPNLLSLDAPLVALAWLFIFAKTWRVDYLPWQAYAALGLAVWVVHVADGLLEAAIRGGNSPRLRHHFHLRHGRLFKIGAAVAAIVSLALVVDGFSITVFNYLLVAVVLLAGFFSISLFSDRENGAKVLHSKNILAGFTFAFGTAMVAHVFIPGTIVPDLIWSRELLCFAALCSLGISAIDVWEHAERTNDPEAKAAYELTLTVPLTLLGLAALWFAYLDHEMTTRPFFYAILTGAALLYILNRTRSRFSREDLRVLADAALVGPLLVFLGFPAA